jgi:hypothetical protein
MTCRLARPSPNDIQPTYTSYSTTDFSPGLTSQQESMIRSGAGSTSTHPMESIPWMRATIITLICIFGVVSCSAWEVSYLNGATGQATEQDILHTLGIPSEKGQLDTGKTLWMYQHKTSFYIYPVACRKYELTFNDQQVLQQWKYLACKDEQPLPWVQ